MELIVLKYRVVVIIDREIESEWVKWMHDVHIPHVLNTNLFSNASFLKNIENLNEAEYITEYSIDTHQDFQKYLLEFASALREEINEKYDGKYKTRRELLELVNFFE